MEAMVICISLSKHGAPIMAQHPRFCQMPHETLFGLMDLSIMFLMPWVGVRAAQAACTRRVSPYLLLGVLSRESMFDGTVEEALWKQKVLPHVARQVAAHLCPAIYRTPEFRESIKSIKVLETIVSNINTPLYFSKKNSHEIVVPTNIEEWQGRTLSNPQGFFLQFMIKPDQQAERMNVRIHADPVDLKSGTIMPVFIGGQPTWNIDCEVQFLPARGDAQDILPEARRWSGMFFAASQSNGLFDFLPNMATRGNYIDEKGWLKLQFATRHSKLHLQCYVLTSFFSKTSEEIVSIEDVWLQLQKPESKNDVLASILKEFLCRMFANQTMTISRHFTWKQLGSITSSDFLKTYQREHIVLRNVIEWGMDKSSRPVQVGDILGLRGEEADGKCRVVKAIEADRLLLAQEGEEEAEWFERSKVWDAGEWGFLHLLDSVRFGYICMESLCSDLSQQQTNYASAFDKYKDLLKMNVDLKLGKMQPNELPGTHGRPRFVCLFFFDFDYVLPLSVQEIE